MSGPIVIQHQCKRVNNARLTCTKMIIIGNGNYIKGDWNVVIGNNNKCTGKHNFMIGNYITSDGDFSISCGTVIASRGRFCVKNEIGKRASTLDPAVVSTKDEAAVGDFTCCICQTNKPCILTQPCNEVRLCAGCAILLHRQDSVTCPTCREPVQQFTRVYF